MYGWFPQHRAGTTEDELKETAWWVDGVHKGFHKMGDGAEVSVYERGLVHLNLNRWPDPRWQFEYVTLEAIGYGCIPVARIEHFAASSDIQGIGIPEIRKKTNKPEEWKETAEHIFRFLLLSDNAWREIAEHNWDILERTRLPEIVAGDILEAQYNSRDSVAPVAAHRQSVGGGN